MQNFIERISAHLLSETTGGCFFIFVSNFLRDFWSPNGWGKSLHLHVRCTVRFLMKKLTTINSEWIRMTVNWDRPAEGGSNAAIWTKTTGKPEEEEVKRKPEENAKWVNYQKHRFSNLDLWERKGGDTDCYCVDCSEDDDARESKFENVERRKKGSKRKMGDIDGITFIVSNTELICEFDK